MAARSFWPEFGFAARESGDSIRDSTISRPRRTDCGCAARATASGGAARGGGRRG